MPRNVLCFLSLLFVGITMSAGLAHVMALPNKIGMSAEHYFVAQQTYAGWAMIGIAMIGAFIATLVLALMRRSAPREFIPALIAFHCMAAALAVFFAFTYPANQATENWTVLPQNWEQLRAQWEYSHAVGAVLVFAAFVALVVAVLSRR
jgi:hypothetical protein